MYCNKLGILYTQQYTSELINQLDTLNRSAEYQLNCFNMYQDYSYKHPILLNPLFTEGIPTWIVELKSNWILTTITARIFLERRCIHSTYYRFY